MNSGIKEQAEKFSLFSLKNSKKLKLDVGDLVKILDENKNVIEYAYLIKDIHYEQGWPFIEVRTQRTNKTLKMVLTDAIQKV